MFIANLNAKVDFLDTYKLIQLNRKIPFKEKPGNSETTLPRVKRVNQVSKQLRYFTKHSPHTPPLADLNSGQLHRNSCI